MVKVLAQGDTSFYFYRISSECRQIRGAGVPAVAKGYRTGKVAAIYRNHGTVMVITDSAVNGWRVIILEGKFVIRNLTMIRKAFELAEREVGPGIAIDMSGVSQIDSSAITLLINFQRRVIQKDALLVLFGMRPDIAEIFSIVGIDKLFRICSSKQDFEALYALYQ